MEKKIPVKTIYLLMVISVGLIALGVGSTYAVFTKSAEINNPIAFSSSLSYDSDVIEAIKVTILPGEVKTSTFSVSNITNNTLNYVAWYLNEGYDIDLGVRSGNSTGSIASGSSSSIDVDIRNNSNSTVTVTLGISSNNESVVLGNNIKQIPDDNLPPIALPAKATTYINSLYDYASKSPVTNNGITYNYAKSVNLMKDRLGGTTTDYDDGNIRYYGSDPNNYVYFNCNDYSNQNSTNCETWRIIGIVDGKLKLIRNDSLGTYSYDYKSDGSYSNDWSGASLKSLLKGGYLDNSDGISYYNNSTTPITINFKSDRIGITDATRHNNLIANSTWYINNSGNDVESTYVYSNDIYVTERSGATATGEVALAYPSDYGYATDLSQCSENLHDYDATDSCISTNWMKNILTDSGTGDGWLLTPHGTSSAWRVYSTGALYDDYEVFTAFETVPVLYLNSELSFSSGDGSKNNPYKLSNVEYYAGKYFDGLDDYYSAGYAYNDFGKSISIGARFNVSSIKDGEIDLIDNFEGGGFGINFFSGVLAFTVYSTSSSSYKMLYSITPEVGKWYTVVVTYDGSTIKLYVDGVLNNSMSFTDNIKVTSADVVLGSNAYGNGGSISWYNGIISDAFVSRDVLTESEIRDNFTDKFNYTSNSNTYFYYDFK